MSGLQIFIAIDVALVAALIHWRVWQRRAPSPSEDHAAPTTNAQARQLGAGGPEHRPPAAPHATPQLAPPDLNTFGGNVHVVDGDTVKINGTRVRLFGMDAPELSQRGGYQAKSQLIRMAGGKRVRVLPVAVDCYGRIVGRVLLGQIDLSHAMVREGYAVAMRAYHADYIPAEEAARREGRGLWAGNPQNGIDDPAAHRRWKAAQEQRRQTRQFPGSVTPLNPPPLR